MTPMKIVATRKSEQNRAAVDPWTVVHFSTGLALGLLNVPRSWAVGVSVGYELAEQVFERSERGRELFVTHGPESAANALVDSVVLLGGHWLGRRWNRPG